MGRQPSTNSQVGHVGLGLHLFANVSELLGITHSAIPVHFSSQIIAPCAAQPRASSYLRADAQQPRGTICTSKHLPQVSTTTRQAHTMLFPQPYTPQSKDPEPSRTLPPLHLPAACSAMLSSMKKEDEKAIWPLPSLFPLAAAQRRKQVGNQGRLLHKEVEISLQKQLYPSISQF